MRATKYFLDTEFIEAFHKPWFGKRRHFIDLISIGIRCEDGRELHLISSEYDYSKASMWVRQNVIHPLYLETVPEGARMTDPEIPGTAQYILQHNFHKSYGRPNKEIAEEIIKFTQGELNFALIYDQDSNPVYFPEFYGYFCDYDWVVFCALFGTMMDLPKGYPMYCIDLKQMLDDKAKHYAAVYNMPFEVMLDKLKADPKYPKNDEHEHNAIADARWNEKLLNFIKTI